MLLQIGGILFDVIIKTDHNFKVSTTSFPIENGASISDHAFIEPAEISVEVMVSDFAQKPPNSNDFGTENRALKSFSELINLQYQRRLISVATRFRTYRNMLITGVAVPDDYMTMSTFRANIMLREIPVINTSRVTASNSRQGQKTARQTAGRSTLKK